MKTLTTLLGAVVLAALALSGCNGVVSGVSATNDTLAHLAQNDIPAACSIITTAEGYFETLAPKIAAANKVKYTQAKTVVADICANPPTNVVSALITLGNEWAVIQAATVTTK